MAVTCLTALASVVFCHSFPSLETGQPRKPHVAASFFKERKETAMPQGRNGAHKINITYTSLVA